MRKAFLAAQNAAKAGNAAALTQARSRVQGLFSALFVQAIVTYVHEVGGWRWGVVWSLGGPAGWLGRLSAGTAGRVS
jgi:hypothetical protein